MHARFYMSKAAMNVPGLSREYLNIYLIQEYLGLFRSEADLSLSPCSCWGDLFKKGKTPANLAGMFFTQIRMIDGVGFSI